MSFRFYICTKRISLRANQTELIKHQRENCMCEKWLLGTDHFASIFTNQYLMIFSSGQNSHILNVKISSLPRSSKWKPMNKHYVVVCRCLCEPLPKFRWCILATLFMKHERMSARAYKPINYSPNLMRTSDIVHLTESRV